MNGDHSQRRSDIIDDYRYRTFRLASSSQSSQNNILMASSENPTRYVFSDFTSGLEKSR